MLVQIRKEKDPVPVTAIKQTTNQGSLSVSVEVGNKFRIVVDGTEQLLITTRR